MQRILGIDLGTTYSCVSVFNEKRGVFDVLPSKTGQQTTPSVVAVNAKGELVVGDAAKRMYASAKPGQVVKEIKRHMGELGADHKPYVVSFAGRDHTPEEISSYVLREMKEAAEMALGEPVTAAVITVPAYFEEPQRQATMRAGVLAGLDVKRIINEPTAAAIAYGHAKTDDDEDDDDGRSRNTRLLIYDLGGGTFDVSVIEVERGNLRVLATTGDHYLGGVDFDEMITRWVCAQIKARWGIDIEAIAARPDKEGQRAVQALQRIRLEVENYKRELSTQESVVVSFAVLTVTDPRTDEMLENVEIELSRAEFEAMISAKLAGTIASVDSALRDAKLAARDIDEVVLVGGSTRIPMVRRLLTQHFGKEPRTNIHPDLCVALGAAQEALKYVESKAIPTSEVRNIVDREKSNLPMVVDVTGHSLGVEVDTGAMSVLIPRQTPIPTMRTQMYETSQDNQTQVPIRVYQGEGAVVAENTMLREFMLAGLPRKPRGQVKIEITFALDANDRLIVTAIDPATGKQSEIEIRDERLRPTSAEALLPSAGIKRSSAPTPIPTPIPVDAKPATRPANFVAPPKFAKFVDQAELLLPTLDATASARLRDALRVVYAATDAASHEAAGNALVDVLFDVRPF